MISPEGCASILWRDAGQAATAAEALKLTAADLKSLKLIDQIVAEPLGGAHREPAAAVAAVGTAIGEALAPLLPLEPAALRQQRREKFPGDGAGGVGLKRARPALLWSRRVTRKKSKARQGKQFFFEKRTKKLLGALSRFFPESPRQPCKSLLLLFFRKEGLPA